MNQPPYKTYCPICGCGACILRFDCPNKQFACEECTPSKPAWQGCVYYQKQKKKEVTP